MPRKKHEQTFCTALNKWWEYVGSKEFDKTLVVEAKISEDNCFNYKGGFKDHQIRTLINYKNKPMAWKISDMDRTSSKHFDNLLSHNKAVIPCVAIKWIGRGNKTFYLIDPDIILGRIDDGKKSLTESEAQKLCFYVGLIK